MDTYKIRKLKNEYVFIHDYIEQNMSLLKMTLKHSLQTYLQKS